MSGATYRMESHHTPGGTFSWYVKVYRLADDGYPVYTTHDSEPGRGELRARRWIAEQASQVGPFTQYVGDDGQDAEAPHSVKV